MTELERSGRLKRSIGFYPVAVWPPWLPRNLRNPQVLSGSTGDPLCQRGRRPRTNIEEANYSLDRIHDVGFTLPTRTL